MKFIQNLIKVILASLFNYGSSFIIGLILPMVLSVHDYGRYRQYTLFLSFAYILNIGFNDGIYIKYGGKDKKDLDIDTIKDEHNFLVFYQLLITLVLTILALLYGDPIYMWFSISAFFILINTYHQNFRQAIGDFHVYSYSTMLTSVLYTSLLLMTIFIFQNSNYQVYIFLTLLSYIILFLIYEVYFSREFGISKQFSSQRKLQLIKVGMFILIGNMSMAYVGNAGNWLVNIFFDLESFAQYSFQNSLLNISLLIVSAISLVFYNLLAANSSKTIMDAVITACVVIGEVSGIGYFVIYFFVSTVLPKYMLSLPILSVTFLALPFIILSNILLMNLYKVKVDGKIYLRNSVLFAITSTIIILALLTIFGTLISVAIGILVSYMLWVAYNFIVVFKDLNFKKKHLLSLAAYMVIHILVTTYMMNIFGFIVYILFVIVQILLFRTEIAAMVKR
ncbi:polysaccharide biosynthesis protein [Granulicatella seriolae]|uniref:Polysaccharide biosynthesis protein n=1 Tax=Granulicatella seriolae TaxID=2967226 RepID=A0ABT1WPK7_9LACT|nr:hypothetical protein [Granulicatella seriolae]